MLFLLAAGLFIGLDIWGAFDEVSPSPAAAMLEEPTVDGLGADVETDKGGWPPEAFRRDPVDALAAELVWAAVDLRTEEAVWNTGGPIDGIIEPPLLGDAPFCSVIPECYRRWVILLCNSKSSRGIINYMHIQMITMTKMESPPPPPTLPHGVSHRKSASIHFM